MPKEGPSTVDRELQNSTELDGAAEPLMREALAIYSGLDLERDVEVCSQFIEGACRLIAQ